MRILAERFLLYRKREVSYKAKNFTQSSMASCALPTLGDFCRIYQSRHCSLKLILRICTISEALSPNIHDLHKHHPPASPVRQWNGAAHLHLCIWATHAKKQSDCCLPNRMLTTHLHRLPLYWYLDRTMLPNADLNIPANMSLLSGIRKPREVCDWITASLSVSTQL